MTPPFSVYIHVPFCAVRCGYCDFNTYTVGFGAGAEPDSYAESVRAEMAFAAATGATRPARTVYLGGGTPSLLPDHQIEAILEGVRAEIGIEAGAEVSMEANPDTVTPARAQRWATLGVTRLSMGMQSAVPHVLATLDRTHDPRAVEAGVRAARSAGLDVSLDLIYGTPGESLDDWRTSLEEAIGLGPDHLSAYGLVIEEGTRMGALVRRGELAEADGDDEAEKYLLADRLLAEAGYRWYEISNWARPVPGEEDVVDATRLAHVSRHNLGYWMFHEWWGFGPGAHSFVAGRRWWNVKHPRAYAAALAAGRSPEGGSETPTPHERHLERVMLGIRLARGLDLSEVDDEHAEGIDAALAAGQARVREDAGGERRLVLTVRGRLMADEVTRRLAL